MPNHYDNQTEEEFDRAYEQEEMAEERGIDKATLYDYSEFQSSLGDILSKLFDDYEQDRKLTEERWIKDLRQYRGEYDPETLAKLHPKRSKAFLSLTRTKTKTVSSRMTDLLFPANGERNWGVDPTPIPELIPEVLEMIVEQYIAQTGEEPTEELIRQGINEEARKRCENMQKEMEDQLAELKYRAMIRQTILDGNLYGTGILKGPLGRIAKSKRWLPTPDGTDWVTINLEQLKPYVENVSVWDIYPDMSARRPEDMRGLFQRYVMNRHKVLELAQRDDFNGEAIKAYLMVHAGGDAEYKPFEDDLKALNDASEADTSKLRGEHENSGVAFIKRKGKYEVKEFWGFLDANELRENGVDIPEELDCEVAANVWTLGDIVIKANVAPIEGAVIPYHFYYYEKDDTSIWGEGIPSIMRDSQKLFNASVRAMLDNAAISAGPIIEANMDLLEPNEDPKDLFPFRVFLRDGQGADASAQAIRVYSLPSYTNEFMAMIQFFMNASDEVTAIPRYLYGDTNNVGGAGKTATGLSMLMGSANITLKDQVKNFDDGVTIPFIRALYFWNMDFNLKENIKGDYQVSAKGSTSLIAREVKSESLLQFLNITNNPTDLMYTKRENVLREMVKVMDLDEFDLIKDSNQIKVEAEARAQAAKEDEDFEKQIAMMKAQSGGHMNNDPGTVTAEGAAGSPRPGMERLSPEQLQDGQIPSVSPNGV
jgi:hypothetical protein